MSSHAMAYSRGVTLVDYGTEVEHEIVTLQKIIEENATLADNYNPRWLAIKLLEEDSDITAKVDADRCGGSCPGPQGCPFVIKVPRTFSLTTADDD